MTPKKNQKVKIVFRTGGWAEGSVISWSDQKTVLKSPNNSICVIQRTAEDVIAYTIVSPDEVLTEEPEPAQEVAPEAHHQDTQIKMIDAEMEKTEEEFQAAQKSPSENPERLSRMAQLKIKLAEMERKSLSAKLKSIPPLLPNDYNDKYVSPFLRGNK